MLLVVMLSDSASICVGLAQPPPDAQNVEKMSLADAKAVLDFGGPSGRRALLSSAFTAKQIDIIKICFEDPRLWEEFSEKLQAAPESPFKHEVLISVLLSRSVSLWDGYPMDEVIPFHVARERTLRAAALIPMIQTVLPDVPSGYQAISTPEKRFALAHRFAEAGRIHIEDPTEARRVWPPNPRQPRIQSGEAVRSSDRSAIAEKPVKEIPATGLGYVWMGFVAVSLVGLALWLFARNRRTESPRK